jgi:hypothetical protein
MGKNHASPWQGDAARSGDKAEEAEVRTTEPTVILHRKHVPLRGNMARPERRDDRR